MEDQVGRFANHFLAPARQRSDNRFSRFLASPSFCAIFSIPAALSLAT